MLVNAAIVQFLEHRNIKYIFHLPGIHTLPLNSALFRSKITVLMGRHEATTAFMADGFARVTGEAAVLLVTPGPGLGNVVTACMEAHGDDVPLVILFVDVDRKNVAKGILHGVREPEALFTNITKGIFVISGERDLLFTLEAAFRTAVSPRQGPVLVSIPYRLLEREVPLAGHECGGPGKETPFDPEPLERALKGTERPVIIAGGGLKGYALGDILDTMCRESAIPFLTSTGGKGVVREDNGYVLGNVMAKGIAREVLRASDVTIALGTRLRDVDTKRRGVKLGRLVHIDVDDRWIERNYPADLAVAGRMGDAVEGLSHIMKGKRSSWDMERLKGSRQREEALLEKNPGFQVAMHLRRSIPDETVTVWDLNLISYWAEYYFPAYYPRSFLSPRGISPIFYGFSAALGAKLGKPGNPCLCITGDGSFSAVAGELATARAYDIPAVVLVYNNGAFGVLEDYMKKRYAIEGTMELHDPDFPGLAQAFGIKSKRAESLEDLDDIFRHDVSWDEPYLVEFRHPTFPPPWA
ncbi:MAG: thiamine pyrophosphate-binding protein [Syntrophorhabdales bacterium]